MDLSLAAQGFAAMGAEARLEVLRVLVRAGETGLTVGEVRDRTGIAASTLAHHLKFLAAAEVVVQEKAGRSTICRANFDHLQSLAGFILSECCQDAEMGFIGKVANDG
jgi:DNA-binding transcriptional ArsR family regulator